MTFAQLNMHHSINKAIASSGYETPTDIQAKAIPSLMEGHDMLGSAQTGTGKTAAFALPIIDHVESNPHGGKRAFPQALVLAPTRELALQIKDNFDAYSRHNTVRSVAIFGGMPKRQQIIKVKKGVDVLIATPGRLLDLMNMKVVKLDHIEQFVLDEADHMLDMGFIEDVNKIVDALPKVRQTMLFSATIPKAIEQLSKRMLTRPIRVEITPQHTPLETIDQSVFHVKTNEKLTLLQSVLQVENVESALVFIRTKHGCNNVGERLKSLGINAEIIHGDKTQPQRQRTLERFKAKKTTVLVATDVAARGIDINSLSHVINYDMPEKPETYLHRIGRTARAGKAGRALSFCSLQETHLLKAIQKHINMRIPVSSIQKHVDTAPTPEPKGPKKPSKPYAKNQPRKSAQESPKKPTRKSGQKNGKQTFAHSNENQGHPFIKKSNKPYGKKKHKHRKKNNRFNKDIHAH